MVTRDVGSYGSAARTLTVGRNGRFVEGATKYLKEARSREGRKPRWTRVEGLFGRGAWDGRGHNLTEDTLPLEKVDLLSGGTQGTNMAGINLDGFLGRTRSPVGHSTPYSKEVDYRTWILGLE